MHSYQHDLSTTGIINGPDKYADTGDDAKAMVALIMMIGVLVAFVKAAVIQKNRISR